MTPLRLRMIEDMQIRNLAPLTQSAYLLQVSLFARYFGRSPERLGREDIRAYRLYLAQDKHLAASSIAVAVAALRFFYTVIPIRVDVDSLGDNKITHYQSNRFGTMSQRQRGLVLLSSKHGPSRPTSRPAGCRRNSPRC
jgi:hypothetical protein